MDLKYTIENQQGINVLSLSGNIIEQTQCNQLIDVVNDQIQAGNIKFVVDLKGVKYMNSTGLNFLVMILTKSRKAGGEAVICHVPALINQLLVITKLNSVFTVCEDVDAALNTMLSSAN